MWSRHGSLAVRPFVRQDPALFVIFRSYLPSVPRSVTLAPSIALNVQFDGLFTRDAQFLYGRYQVLGAINRDLALFVV
jgi:hypothetical protein